MNTKIVITSESGYCMSEFAYTDKLVIRPYETDYVLKPVIESDVNPNLKWSYKTDNRKAASLFHRLSDLEGEIAEESRNAEPLKDVRMIDMTFYPSEGKKRTYQFPLQITSRKFIQYVRKFITEIEMTPNCVQTNCA